MFECLNPSSDDPRHLPAFCSPLVFKQYPSTDGVLPQRQVHGRAERGQPAGNERGDC